MQARSPFRAGPCNSVCLKGAGKHWKPQQPKIPNSNQTVAKTFFSLQICHNVCASVVVRLHACHNNQTPQTQTLIITQQIKQPQRLIYPQQCVRQCGLAGDMRVVDIGAHGMAWHGMVEVCEGAPVVMGSWVLADRYDLAPYAANSLHRVTISANNVTGGTGTLGIV